MAVARKPRKRKPQQKVNRALKGFAEAKKPGNDLLREVQNHVVAEGVKNQGVGRESHRIHVSEVVKNTACPRHMYYKVTEEPVSDLPQPAYYRLEMIWAAGHHEHEKWQRWLQEMGDLWGNWVCVACDNVVPNSLEPEACALCGCSKWKYDEAHLEDDEYLLVGHADGAVPRLKALIEVKSFSVGTVRVEDPARVREHTHQVGKKTLVDHEGIWNSIKRPLKSHLRQGVFYLWMCKRMGLDYDRIIFIYENKTTQATKSFEVRLKDSIISDQLDMLSDVFWHVDTGRLPERPRGFAIDGSPCKDCPFRTTCWGENDD